MKLTNASSIPVYTIAGEGTARPLPEWLARKRKRSLKKDSEYANRVELLQDFEFEEASSCVRVSEDGEWVMSTGTYKPQIHVHNLRDLSLSFARHTDALNEKFVLLGSDYGKSLHLQADRSLEFHTPSGLHYTTRVPRYGRDLVYNRRTAEALIPTVGVNTDGNGEVFRLNLEVGRFMKGFEVDVGGDDFASFGGGALQGGIGAGAVNCAAVAEESHGLLAFGTSLGTVEFWDSRSRNRVSVLGPPARTLIFDDEMQNAKQETTALTFDPSGLQLATGSSEGLIHTYDLRSPVPLLRKDQGYGFPIQDILYLTQSTSSSSVSSDKLLSADRKSIKLFGFSSTSSDAQAPLWTSITPAVDLNHVEWVPDSGMLLTANEGRQQHAFFIPQLGPAPKWCAFLDNLVEEMAEDGETDPSGFKAGGAVGGEVYDNYKFVSSSELATLNLDQLITGSEKGTNVLRPYMHGYFVPQRLYEQARLLANPDIALQQRQKSIQEKIDKERESRIRGNKKTAVKVNRKLAEKLAAREEANERRKADRLLRKAERDGEQPRQPAMEEMKESEMQNGEAKAPAKKATTDLMADDRFKRLFEDEDFEIDETSREYQLHNPSSATTGVDASLKKRGLTAVEEEDLEGGLRGSNGSSDDEDREDEAQDDLQAVQRQRRRAGRDHEDENAGGRIGSASYKKSGHKSQRQKDTQQRAGPRMHVSSTSSKSRQSRPSKSFGEMASHLPSRSTAESSGGVVGEKQISFAPLKPQKKTRPMQGDGDGGRKAGRGSVPAKDRRSASGNTFRRM